MCWCLCARNQPLLRLTVACIISNERLRNDEIFWVMFTIFQPVTTLLPYEVAAIALTTSSVLSHTWRAPGN